MASRHPLYTHGLRPSRSQRQARRLVGVVIALLAAMWMVYWYFFTLPARQQAPAGPHPVAARE